MNFKGVNIDDISLDDIYDFIDSRGENLSPEIAHYMALMEKVYDMDHRPMKFGSKEMILKHLMKFDGLSRHLATKVYEDSMEYFYSQSNISKDAHRNRIAERQERLINMGIEMVKDMNDVFKLLRSNEGLVKILNLDKEDAIEMPDDERLKPFQILSMDAKAMELPTRVDRKALEAWVNTLPELTEGEKELIKQEALINPVKLFPEEHENLRKS